MCVCVCRYSEAVSLGGIYSALSHYSVICLCVCRYSEAVVTRRYIQCPQSLLCHMCVCVCVCRSLDSVLSVRSILISRSTYTGGGAHTGHWLGDNTSQWKHLRASIPGQLHSPALHSPALHSPCMPCSLALTSLALTSLALTSLALTSLALTMHAL